MTNGAAESSANYRLLRELGRRSPGSHAAVRGDGSSLFVIQRFDRSTPEDALEVLARDARGLATHWHPNLARVRHVDRSEGGLVVATELLEGVTLEDFLSIAARGKPGGSRAAPLVTHAVLARIFLDVLSGLAAFHGLRDGINSAFGAFHGQVCPANVVIAKDGVARVVALFRPRPVHATAASEGVAYSSPEVLAGEPSQDARADIYSVGIMLWETLMERPLYAGDSPERITQRQREEDVPLPPTLLAEVVARALSFDPLLRFRSAQEMATSVRAKAGAVAPGSAVAQAVADLAGDRIRARRAELDPATAARRISSPARPAIRPISRPRMAAVARPQTPAPPSPVGTARVSAPYAMIAPETTRRVLPDPDSSSRPVAVAINELDEVDQDVLGPEPGMTTQDEIERLAREPDLDDLADDAAALDAAALLTAREVMVSARSVSPLPPERESAGPIPRAALVDAQIIAVPSAPSGTAPAHELSSRTPYADDVAPPSTPPSIAPAPIAHEPVGPPKRRVLPFVAAAIAVFSLLALVAGGRFIARRVSPPEATSATAERATPVPSSTIVAPPPVVDPYPAAADPSTRSRGTRK